MARRFVRSGAGRLAVPVLALACGVALVADVRLADESLGLLGLVAAFPIVFNRLSTMFTERASELDVLRAVGLRRDALWRMLVGEGLVVGAAGMAVGIPLGIGLGRRVVPVIAGTVAHELVLADAALVPEPGTLLLAGALGLATAALAAALAAWRATRVALVDTMPGRGQEPAGGDDTVLAVVLGRTRELGAVRASGVRRASLVRRLLVEGLLTRRAAQLESAED